MTESVFRAIGAVLEALLDVLVAHTGKRVLSFVGVEVESVRRGSYWTCCLGDYRNRVDRSYHSSISQAVGPPLAHRVILRRRGSLIASEAKRTWPSSRHADGSMVHGRGCLEKCPAGHSTGWTDHFPHAH
jgi:hypothetical protein